MLRVKEICKEQGITQAELSKRLNVSPSALNQSIIGNPSLDKIQEIANALEVPITELFASANDEFIGVIRIGGDTHVVNSEQDLKKLLKKAELHRDASISMEEYLDRYYTEEKKDVDMHFGDWLVEPNGDMENNGYYITADRLTENEWFLHLQRKSWMDWNDFIPAYFQACCNAGLQGFEMKIFR